MKETYAETFKELQRIEEEIQTTEDESSSPADTGDGGCHHLDPWGSRLTQGANEILEIPRLSNWDSFHLDLVDVVEGESTDFEVDWFNLGNIRKHPAHRNSFTQGFHKPNGTLF